jgi:CDP-alcohol phosphatidyltransferase family protein
MNAEGSIMSINNLKYKIQHFLHPLAAKFDQWGIKASHITILSAIISIAVGAVVTLSSSQALFWLIPIWLFISLVLLNNLADILVYDFENTSGCSPYFTKTIYVVAMTAAYIPFMFVAPFDPLQIGVVILLSILLDLNVFPKQNAEGDEPYDGPLDKVDRAFLLGEVAILYALFSSFSSVLYWAPWVLVASLVLTLIIRIKLNRANTPIPEEVQEEIHQELLEELKEKMK